MLIKNFKIKPVLYFFSMLIPIVLTIYYYPRYLVKTFGENSPWLGYLYTYGIGGILFILSLLWIFTRPKDRLRKREELLWLLAISFGLIFSFSLHGLWILLSLSTPIKF